MASTSKVKALYLITFKYHDDSIYSVISKAVNFEGWENNNYHKLNKWAISFINRTQNIYHTFCIHYFITNPQNPLIRHCIPYSQIKIQTYTHANLYHLDKYGHIANEILLQLMKKYLEQLRYSRNCAKLFYMYFLNKY